jgi:hypothetical protein
MSQYNKYITELNDEGSILKIEKIKSWLLEYESYFKFLINETTCRKWSKWLKDKPIHLFPCACHTREGFCVFIETYYELEKIIDLYHRQDKIAEVLKGFDQIKNNPDLEFEWVEKYSGIANFYDGKLQIKGEEGKSIKFEFDKDEFYTAILFQDIKMEIYCSEGYQIRSKSHNNTLMFDEDELSFDDENY